jgi:flagellar biosynthesis protein FliQ
MKGLEEQIEIEEKEKQFLKKIVLHISTIVISSSLLIKEISDFINEKDESFERNKE